MPVKLSDLWSVGGAFSPTRAATSALAGAGIYGLLNPDSGIGEFMGMGGGSSQPTGYMGGIPEYTLNRELAPNAFATTTDKVDPVTGAPISRRPGSMGRQYFTDTTYTPTGNALASPVAPAAPTAGLSQTDQLAGLLGGLPEDVAAQFMQNYFGSMGINFDAAETTGTQIAADAYNTFLGPYYNKTLTDAQITELVNSEYNLDQIATSLGIPGGGAGIQSAYTNIMNKKDVADAYSAITVDNEYTADEYRMVTDLIASGKTNITGVAKQFGVTPEVVADRLLNTGMMTPDELLTYYQQATPDLTMEQLLGRLANSGETTVKEIAGMFPEYTEEEIGFELINQGYMTPSQLTAQYPDLNTQQITAMYNKMGGTKFAQGGNVNGYYLGGPTDGMADQIPATINNMEPAKLSDGEFVVPADVVSHLGNGNSDAGAQNLYSMMDRIRKDRTGTTKQGRQIDPNNYLV